MIVYALAVFLGIFAVGIVAGFIIVMAGARRAGAEPGDREDPQAARLREPGQDKP